MIKLIKRSKNKAKERGSFYLYFLDERSFDYMYREIFERYVYQFKSTNRKPFIIDCGSNIGLSVLYFKKLYPLSRILSFEPFPAAFEVLKKNIEENKITNVECFNAAVSDKADRTNMYYGSKTTGPLAHSLVRERGGSESIVIETVELARYVNEPIDLLKLDIEGSEMRVMMDLFEKNELKFIEQIIFEYHHHIHPNDDNLSLMLKILEDSDYGYQLYSGPQPYKEDRHFQDILIRAYKKQRL